MAYLSRSIDDYSTQTQTVSFQDILDEDSLDNSGDFLTAVFNQNSNQLNVSSNLQTFINSISNNHNDRISGDVGQENAG